MKGVKGMPTMSKSERTVRDLVSMPTIKTEGARQLKVDTGSRRVWIEPHTYTGYPVATVDIKSSINGVWYERLETYCDAESVVWLHGKTFNRHVRGYVYSG